VGGVGYIGCKLRRGLINKGYTGATSKLSPLTTFDCIIRNEKSKV